MSQHQESVARHYNGLAFQFEQERLEVHSPVEYAITCRYLRRHIPEDSLVAELGVGVGHYSAALARRGCRVHLVDVADLLLESAVRRLREERLESQVAGVTQASATHLGALPSATFDAVVLLGPLYHLCLPEERRQCVTEAHRILKSGGVLCAAGINRLAYLRDMLRDVPARVLRCQEFHRQFLRDGNLDPQHAPPIGYAHLTTVEEFRSLFRGLFDEVALAGTESFAVSVQQGLKNLSAEETEAWLDLIETTGSTPEGLGVADHFLYVGRKTGKSDRPQSHIVAT